ncbi:MAG: MFS transporter, partial [Oscillospiraceae bacterium]|nr:MFS transporter [Oscillospiraceae bacterium]
ANKFAKKIGGMKNVLVVSSAASLATRLANYFIGYETFPRFVLIHAVGMAAGVTGIMATIAMTALWGDSIDYLEWKTGRRTEGISFALQNFLGKAAGGIQSVIRGQLLAGLRYDGALAQRKIPQNAAFRRWAWPLNQLGPALGALMSLIPVLCIRYPEAMKRQVEAELARRREAILKEQELC